jgi:hypothetical protein
VNKNNIYFELKKKETVKDNKNIILLDLLTKKLLEGSEGARMKL